MPGGGGSREPMLEMFLFETAQLIEQLEEIVIRCENSKKLDPGDINEIFRIMHTTKGSAAMMLFNNISRLAHSLEDLFFFIRENRNAAFDFAKLSDLVLSFADFTKGELDKIDKGIESDRAPDEYIDRIKTYLEEMRNSCDDPGLTVNSPSPGKEKRMYYISKLDPELEKTQQKYCARIYFEEDCQMENIRSYTIVHNLKEICGEVYSNPAELLDNPEAAGLIKRVGLFVGFDTDLDYQAVEKILSETVLLRQMELRQVEEYPAELKSLTRKREINLDDFVDDVKEKTPEPVQPHPAEIRESGGKEAGTTLGGRQQSIISVSIRKLDTLLDLVGEIVISEAMLTSNPGLEGVQLENFSKAARQMKKLTSELQDIVMSIRMVPISATFHKMNRIVRDMGRQLNKDVELEIIGEETEVDKNIIDHLSDPLMHLIRNSMDHGLESREERTQTGKPLKAKITLEARNAGGEVWIIVKDDGKGLNREKILSKARDQGLVNKPESELTDKEVFSFILLPGFSTKEKVSEFSGRGVGMDVVKKNIEKIGGSIGLESAKGKGTEVLIQIPLTLAIIDGIEIEVGRSRYTVPTTAIRESFSVADKKVIVDSDSNEIIMIRGQCYPIMRIHRMFNIESAVTNLSEGIMVMIEAKEKAICLFADRLLGEQQVVVKTLPAYIKKAQGIAGCTILGDGGISLILDVNGIVDKQYRTI